VNTPKKPDPARAWLFVQKLLDEEEIERIGKLSEEELDRELRALGIEPSRLPSAEELLAKAAERAKRRQPTNNSNVEANGKLGPEEVLDAIEDSDALDEAERILALPR
jgi:hypothetical protein